MEASSLISFSFPKTHRFFYHYNSFSSSLTCRKPFFLSSQNPRPKLPKALTFSPSSRNSLPLSSAAAIADALETTAESSTLKKGSLSKIDKSGRFCSPRAARELALLIAYAACLEGSDPVWLFDKRVNAKRVPGYVFDKASLLQYDHMSFGGEPVQVETEEEAEELTAKNENDSVNEGEVLSAPLKLVYNKFILRFSRDILAAVVDHWNQHVLIIDKIIPPNWKCSTAIGVLQVIRGSKANYKAKQVVVQEVKATSEASSTRNNKPRRQNGVGQITSMPKLIFGFNVIVV